MLGCLKLKAILVLNILLGVGWPRSMCNCAAAEVLMDSMVTTSFSFYLEWPFCKAQKWAAQKFTSVKGGFPYLTGFFPHPKIVFSVSCGSLGHHL